MRNRIPFLFAALLVAALIAVVGVAAFSISDSNETQPELTFEGPISARVASAILAVSVSTPPDEIVAPVSVAALVPEVQTIPESTTATTSSPSTTEAPAAAEAPPSTAAADTTPPPLVITSPENGATVTSSRVTFSGTSEPGADVRSGPFDAAVDDDGDWSIVLIVFAGQNGTTITATDDAGNETSERIVITYEPPSTTTTTKPKSTTTKPPSTTTTTKAPSNCPVSGSCSADWPADAKVRRGGEYWRSLVVQYWGAKRANCVVDLIQHESGGDPQAKSPAPGSYVGLLQHSPRLWNDRARNAGYVGSDGLTAHPYNGEVNIALGAWLADRSSSWWGPWPPTKNIASCQALGAG